MQIKQLHPWDLSPREAMAVQRELAAQVIRHGDVPESAVRIIAGADVAFDARSGRAVGTVVLLEHPSLEEVKLVVAESQITFPYVPGLLSFRETPVLAGAFERLDRAPDLLMVDGHGYAHPRRFGFACHLGLSLEIPTIGVAKSRLIGSHDVVPDASGAKKPLEDHGEQIGSLLRTREHVRPIYVSVGHRIGLDSAERWVMFAARGYRVPAPTRLADRLSRVAKQRMLDATLDIVIEQRAGEQGRWEWIAGDDAVVFRHDLPPMPTHYGCSVDLLNNADGELLDVMLIDDREYERGEKLAVRVVDVLKRSDGDHKLLAVPLDVEPYSAETKSRLEKKRTRIWQYYIELEKPVTRWGGEDGAVEVIQSCRTTVSQ